MLVMRFQRVGKKHQPSYRLVVAERRSKLGAPPVEDLGSYNSKTKTATLNKDRILHWLKQGAQPSLTIHNLLVKEGVLDKPKIKLTFKSKVKENEAAPAPAAHEPASEQAV